jgi:hypothetical protein
VTGHETWIDSPDVILQDWDADGLTRRIPPSVLVALADEAANSDDGTARWRGHTWDRDHLHSAVDLAIHAGLIDPCGWDDGWARCERPVTDYSVPPRCGWHRKD